MSRLMARWTVAFAPLLALLSSDLAYGQTGSQQSAPVLRINSAFAAPLWRLDVDREERTFVSSSAYKAATLWSLLDPAFPRHVRVPLRDEQRRRAHGIAITPNGDTVAYGVPPLAESNGTPRIGTARIYLVRASDGKIEHIIDKDVPTRPQALKFSADGAWLAAVLSNGCGVRVWETKGWSLVTADDEGYAGPSAVGCCPQRDTAECAEFPDTTGVVFSGTPAAPVLITSGDTGVRLYRREAGRFVLQTAASLESIGLERPEGVAVSPDGRALAVGDRRARGAERSDKPIVLRVAVLALDTLKPLRAPYELSARSSALEFSGYLDPLQVPDARLFSLHRVAWMTEGGNQWIYAAGFFACEAAKRALVQPAATSRADSCVVRWSATRPAELPIFIPTGTDRVMDVLPLARTSRLLVATQRSITVLRADGTTDKSTPGAAFPLENRAADFRGAARPFSISPDGKKVFFEDYVDRSGTPTRLLFDAEALTLSENSWPGEATIAPNQDPNIIGDPVAPRDPRRARWWINTEGPPRFLGEALIDQRLDKDDIYRSVALHLDSSVAVVGSANFLRVVEFGNGAPRIRCEYPMAEEAYRVNITPDGAVIVAGHSDGVLRWYRHVPTGDTCRIELLLSVYVTRTAEGLWTWIAWVPTGEFANHPAAQGLVSWQVSEASGAVKTVDFSRLLAWYKRDTVKRAIATARETAQPVAAETRLPQVLQQAISEQAKQQVLEIVSQSEITQREQFSYGVNLLPSAEQRPRTLSVRTGDGLKVAIVSSAAPDRPQHELTLPGSGIANFDLVLPPAARVAQVAVDLCFFLDGQRQVCKAIQYAGPLAPPPPRRLFAVIAGFSRYDAPGMTLQFAQNDALDLARLFAEDAKRQGTGDAASSFASVEIDLIVAATTSEAEAEAQTLAQLPFVRRRPATRAGLIAALEQLVQRSKGTELSNDVFVFYFSGHGFAHPYNVHQGLTALATSATLPDLSLQNVTESTLASDKLIELIDGISGQKLVIIDACRTPTSAIRFQPFQAGMLTQEFAANALTTYFYFSARDGQFSMEQQDFAYDTSRPPEQRGNGLFTYGLLKAMIPPPATAIERRALDTEDIMRYIEREVFDINDPKSIARRLQQTHAQPIMQTPVYVVARPVTRAFATRHLVLRTAP